MKTKANVQNVFVAAHDWRYEKVPISFVTGEQHYSVGLHLLASCACGIRSVGVVEHGHGKIDQVTTEGTWLDRLSCPATARNHRDGLCN